MILIVSLVISIKFANCEYLFIFVPGITDALIKDDFKLLKLLLTDWKTERWKTELLLYNYYYNDACMLPHSTIFIYYISEFNFIIQS